MKKNEFDATAILSVEAKQKIEWWLNNVEKLEKTISEQSTGIESCCDSSSFFTEHILWSPKNWESLVYN